MRNYPMFKRLNFFTGFFTTADDWNQGEAYHLEKRRLHNWGLHKPGIFQDLDEAGKQCGLAVQADGGLTVRILPGAALDGKGNLICLASAITRTLTLPSDLPKTVYLYIKFDEQCTDWKENVEDPDFNGYARKGETPIVAWTCDAPDNIECLELAHIDLKVGVTEIVDGTNAEGANSSRIKLDGVKKAGAVSVETDRMLDALKERIAKLHNYHLEKERRHNRGNHTPGVLRGVGNQLMVVPVGGLRIEIQPGAALDGEGNELYLDQAYSLELKAPTEKSRIYIAAQYEDHFGDYLTQLAQAFGGSWRTAKFDATTVQPDNQTWLELAHVDLEPGATDIHEPTDPTNPQANEIDHRGRIWSGAIGLVPPQLPPELQVRIDGIIQNTQVYFAELDKRFSVDVIGDVRQAALQLKLMLSLLAPEQLVSLIKLIAGLELGVEHALGQTYPALIPRLEFKAYQEAVTNLLVALGNQQSVDLLLNLLAQVAEAAHSLAQVVFPVPIAYAGPDQTVEVIGDEAKVWLDASGSQAGDKQRIVSYRWEKVI